MNKQKNERILPAYPLFVKDPNFSLWTGADALNEKNVETWFGEQKKIYGFLRSGGKAYCFLGDAAEFAPFGVKKAEQQSLSVTPFSTDYSFKCGKTELKISFVSPLPPDDAELVSLPVCYMEYEISGGENAEISLFVNKNVSYNDLPETLDKRVRGGVAALDGFESAYFGLVRQLPLSNTGDLIGADWGYWYVAGDKAYLTDEKELYSYLSGGYTDFRAVGENRYIAAVENKPSGAILLAYDDCVSIDYFGSLKRGLYLEKHTIFDALGYVRNNRADINAKLGKFGKDMLMRAGRYGENYERILTASLRQVMAAHKVICDDDGKLIWLSKECGSCGCTGTVDVSYPSMPLFAVYNVELLKGLMRPVFKFARMPVWQYDFAPHDVGVYPVCCGQTYGVQDGKGKFHSRLGEGGFWDKVKTYYPLYMLPPNSDIYDFDRQMPVEESADMIIMLYAAYRADKDLSMFSENADLCAKWVKYLVDYGLKPENQLCTDDFAGHLKNNLNLAIKATVAIGAYSELLAAAGERESAARYRKVAENFAAEITEFGKGKKHLPLTWDTGDETFGLKYNLAFDKIFGLALFDSDLMEREADCYIEKLEKFGTPLDNRKMYTKSDWILWAARITSDNKKREKIIAPVAEFLLSSPDRVPFSDWYETQDGKFNQFRARSVQGGCFILLL